MSLRNTTINGVIWSAIQSIGTKIVQLVITIIIARILLPEDYGLVGMLFIFIALGTVIIDSGFGQALIRRVEVTDEQYSSVFYFNTALGVSIYLLLYFLAPFIAEFYEEPRLIDIARVSFLIFPISSLGVVQYTIFSRAINFKLLAKISLIATTCSGVIGVVMAYEGYGVWALVYQSLLFSTFQIVLYWFYSKWRPALSFSLTPIKELLAFSSNLLATNLLIVLFNNIYTLLIGKVYSLDKVGYYNQAKRFEEIPTYTLTTIIQKVSFPVLSKLQNNLASLKQGYKKVINMTVFINFPLMICLMAISNDLFLLLLKEKWLPAVPYFQLLCLHGIFFPLHAINVNILKVKEKGKKLLQLEIARRVLIVIAIVITLPLGIFWLLVGHVVASLLSILINMYFCGKEINFKLTEQVVDILPTFLISVATGVIIYSMTFIMGDLNIYIRLITQMIAGAIVYFFLSFLFKVSSFQELFHIIKNKLK